MALDMQKEFERHQKGWDGFARLLQVSTVAIILLLAVMALTLL